MRILRLFRRKPKTVTPKLMPVETTLYYIGDNMVFVYFKREGKTIASAELYLKSADKPNLERFANLVELMTFN